jgi:hypothetical protein
MSITEEGKDVNKQVMGWGKSFGGLEVWNNTQVGKLGYFHINVGCVGVQEINAKLPDTPK